MVEVLPAGTSLSSQTLNNVSLTVSYKERYRRPKHCKQSSPTQVGVSYAIGEKTLVGTVLYVPVIATITAVYLLCNGESTSKVFTELFTISFQNQDALTSSASIGSYGETFDVASSCCGTTSLLVNDSIIVTVG